MPIVQIAPATRKGMKLLISLFGLSETGKTYSALKLACGIEPDPSKRGLLDTEGGERGRAYVDAIPGGYMYGALSAPFTPERYIEALKDFVAAGVTTLVVDSVSHAWFAEGGVLDMVENASEKNDMAKWAKPKRRLGKLTGSWLGCGLHLILCARGKQPLVEEMVDGRKKLVPGPVVPIQEKSLRFDLSIMALMLGDGDFTIAKEYGGKCPGSLRPVFSGSKMDEQMGQKLIAWVGGQDAKSPEQRALDMLALEIADGGLVALKVWWKTRTDVEREYLRLSSDNLSSIAKAGDAERERIALAEKEAASAADLDAPFVGSAMKGGVQLATSTTKAADPLADNDAPDLHPDAVWLIEQIEAAKDVHALDAFLASPAVQAKARTMPADARAPVSIAETAAREGFKRARAA